MKKPIRIVERKLGREKALGQAYHEERLIEIDPRQPDDEYIDSIIHEVYHLQFPKLPEMHVRHKSRELSKLLWDSGYRRAFKANPDRD